MANSVPRSQVILLTASSGNSDNAAIIAAFYYINGRDKKHGLGSRAEIDKALLKLAESSKNYENPPPESAMCYSIRVPEKVDIQFRCDKCGRTAILSVDEGEEGLIDSYVELTNEFINLGYKAKIMCLCDGCAQRYFPSKSSWGKNNIVFSFSTKNSENQVYSYPSTSTYDDFFYQLALHFLNGCDTVEKLAEVTGTRFEAEVYLDGVKEVIGSEIK